MLDVVNESTLWIQFLLGTLLLVSIFTAWHRRVNPLLDAIPTVGFSDPILSYFSACKFIFRNALMLQEAYEKTKPGLFRIPTLHQWIVVPSGSKLVEEMMRAPENIMSIDKPLEDFLQSKYTIRHLNVEDSYHRTVIPAKLTRNIAATFDQVHDELVGALGEFIPTVDHEWVKVSILPTVERIVCRTSNRVVVGAPLCRDRDYQMMIMGHVENLIMSAFIISSFPEFLKPIVARFVSHAPSNIRQAMEFIRPIVEERSAKMKEFGESWDDAPNDMLMWLMIEAKGVERSLEGWTRRFLTLNFAAIHSTTIAFTRTLYRLLAHPEYIEPLRQEVESVIAKEGWTRAGMDQMHKIDSFVRETQRVDVPITVGLNRLTLRPFTFSNGMTIPAGTTLALPVHSIHMDEEIYPNAQEFDGFRFLKLREKKGDDVLETRHQLVNATAELLGFGCGRHACPGRFLAANLVKAMVAHILLTYDFKLEEGKGVPHSHHIAWYRLPANTNILFRKRQK